jgi:hypothetical protein
VSLARSVWISLVAAAIPTTGATLLWTTPIMSDRGHWLAITATAITGLFWSIAIHVAIVEQCHRTTRQFVEDTINGLAECVVARILDESYGQIAAKIAEHRDLVDDLSAARRNFRHHLDPDTAPIDLQQWRTTRTADGTTHGTAHG